MKRGLIALGVMLLAGASACTEELENDTGCPALCPGQQAGIQTVTIEPVIVDTTVPLVVAAGAQRLMLLASRGDTLDSRVIVRYDSLPARWRPVSTDTTTQPIAVVTRASVRLRIDTTRSKIKAPLTVEVYDVDTTGADTSVAVLASLFRPSRLVGSKTFPVADVHDSLRVTLSDSAVLATLQAARRLRLGFKIAGAGPAQIQVLSQEAGAPAQLTFRPSADTTIAMITVDPSSLTPGEPDLLRINLADYRILVRAPAPGSPADLNVGGLPAKRVYLRFIIPPSILDSATIVRATLLLSQRPNRTIDQGDSIQVTANLVLANAAVTDLARAATILADPSIVGLESLRAPPGDSAERSIDIASVVRFWRSVKPAETPHALVLAVAGENGSPLELRFFATEAAPSLRPRLRISYTKRTPFGLP